MSTIKTENGYHVIHGNRWSADRYTREQAQAFAATMENCQNCMNCSDCSDCSYCSGCKGIPAGSGYASFIGLYRYVCSPRIHEDGAQWIQMGCHLRTRAEWESDPHNNPNEFPEGSPQLAERDYALSVAIGWLDRHAANEGGE